MLVDVITGYAAGLTKDIFTKSPGNTVTISCNNRGDPIVGILGKPLEIHISSEYKDFMSIGGEAAKIIEAADAVTTALLGTTVQQPWFSRKYWVKTSPLTINTSLVFIAQNDAKTEVFDQVERLCGFMYPRELNSENNSLAKSFVPPGPNLFSGRASQDDATIVGGAFGKEKSSPDYISFDLGSMVSLEMCYLRDAQVVSSSALDSDGYPHMMTVAVQIDAFDGSYWPQNGSFHFTQQAGLAFNVNNVLETVKERASDLRAKVEGPFGGK